MPFVLDVLAFQSMREGFLYPKCYNFFCLHTRQDQDELHLKRYLFLPKSVSSISRSVAIFPSVVQEYIQPYLFRRKDNTNYLSRNKHLLKIKTLDGGPYSRFEFLFLHLQIHKIFFLHTLSAADHLITFVIRSCFFFSIFVEVEA